MAAEGVRISLTLVDLMNLNLVHRRLQRMVNDGPALVGTDEFEGLVSILDGLFGMDAQELRKVINDLRRANNGG